LKQQGPIEFYRTNRSHAKPAALKNKFKSCWTLFENAARATLDAIRHQPRKRPLRLPAEQGSRRTPSEVKNALGAVVGVVELMGVIAASADIAGEIVTHDLVVLVDENRHGALETRESAAGCWKNPDIGSFRIGSPLGRVAEFIENLFGGMSLQIAELGLENGEWRLGASGHGERGSGNQENALLHFASSFLDANLDPSHFWGDLSGQSSSFRRSRGIL
jgi:hypothetical protein